MAKALLKVDVVSVKQETIDVPDKRARSGFKSVTRQKVYGKKGEEVSVISDQGNVWIVENSKGERFAVKETDLIK